MCKKSLHDEITTAIYRAEVSLARLSLARGDFAICFSHLERAHVVSQHQTVRHVQVHCLMLLAGLRQADYREVLGQIPRILASLLFSTIWVPQGNSGRARVNAFQPMPVPEELRHLFS